jgi:hypothetical protein
MNIADRRLEWVKVKFSGRATLNVAAGTEGFTQRVAEWLRAGPIDDLEIEMWLDRGEHNGDEWKVTIAREAAK